MRVLAALSGGVDSSVAAAMLLEAGHEVVGATMKLWGGQGDSGCCSVGDVEDARRVAQQLGIAHHVFNLTEDFEEKVVSPYVSAHAAGRTPNPCIACNRYLKFDRLLARARRLGFDALATGHHARTEKMPDGTTGLFRGADPAKDQSYVLSVLTQSEISGILLPVGEITKTEVRARAAELGLRTATKPDSLDTCFIRSDEGRSGFLGARIPMKPAKTVDFHTGEVLGSVSAVELVTVGQRRGLGATGRGSSSRRYAVEVDIEGATVKLGSLADLLVSTQRVTEQSWTGPRPAPAARFAVQSSAHGTTSQGWLEGDVLHFAQPRPRVAPGQTVAFYEAERVLGSATAAL